MASQSRRSVAGAGTTNAVACRGVKVMWLLRAHVASGCNSLRSRTPSSSGGTWATATSRKDAVRSTTSISTTTKSYDRLNLGILELMRRVKPGSRPHTRRVPGCVISTVSWKHWPCLFPQHGPGRKHERSIALEDWQEEIVRAFPAAFLRGLFHSDGARVNNWATRLVAGEMRRYDYPAGSSPIGPKT